LEAVKDLRPQKTVLRKFYKEYRDSLPESEKNRLDKKIQNKLLNTHLFRDEKNILVYVSMKREVNTFEIIETAFSMRKTVAAPRCVPGTRDMDFYIINSLEDFEESNLGVLEPDMQKCEKYSLSEGGVCIVPALAFDKNGYRLGYGKGYYDRFLSNFNGMPIGLCHTSCLSGEGLPHGRYDKRVSLIITEDGIIYI